MTFDHCLCSRDATSTSTAVTTLHQHPAHGPPAWEATGLLSQGHLSPLTTHTEYPTSHHGPPAGSSDKAWTPCHREAQRSQAESPTPLAPCPPPPTIPTGWATPLLAGPAVKGREGLRFQSDDHRHQVIPEVHYSVLVQLCVSWSQSPACALPREPTRPEACPHCSPLLLGSSNSGPTVSPLV